MRVLFQAVYAITLVAAGAAGSFVWLRQIQPQLDANHILHSVSWYRAHPDDMPGEWSDGLADADEATRARRIADFIAGMTDRFALVEHARLFDSTPELR